MNLEERLKQIWQSQFSGCPLRLQEGPLLQNLQYQERSFRRGLFFADMGMMGLSCSMLLALGYLFWRAMREPLPEPGVPGPGLIWPAMILALPLTGLVLFLAVDRFHFRRRHPKPEETVRAFAASFLAQLDHRITLCKNVFWWFILPIIGVADLGFRCYTAWWVGAGTGETRQVVGTVLAALLECAVVGTALFYLMRWLIRKHLQPRKTEMQALLMSLDEPQEDSGRQSAANDVPGQER